ncbi:MAG: 2,3-bisphosphoglycerate-independent phosphoglycerate mutase [Clostridiales bacterium]|jgi:2,3-bisphosphoglycerate-independent phosphoglycerate mutase|nr:2,3-bisphosphoglycerate-independent phosphoglycerate mutase [Clostridiales bacterium]
MAYNGKKLALIVMDGVGLRGSDFGNAVNLAYTPTLDELMAKYPFTQLKAHGTAVGLPDDSDMGNSEVGHNAIGCGQIYSQGAKLVNVSIETGALFKSPVWEALVRNARMSGGTMHFLGLLSDGNVHSHINHLKALITGAKASGAANVRVHALLDGRDVPATSALEYIDVIEKHMAALNGGGFDARIASGGGRMKVTMDRYEADWSMVRRGWETHVMGEGRRFTSAREAVLTYRREDDGVIDQDLPPFVVARDGEPIGRIADGDSVVLFNFRGDRAIEISRAFDDAEFTKFPRPYYPKVMYAGMLQYDGDAKIPNNYLVTPPDIKNTLSELLVANGVRQYAVSETQKYGHVTYFWNGNKTGKFSEELEEYREIPSDNVSFDERPWMKCAEVTDAVIAEIIRGEYGFIRANYPNGDMVGHTGNFQAARVAVESVDLCLKRLLTAARAADMAVIVTADHGNADEMYEATKDLTRVKPKTSHTLNPVPFIIYDAGRRYELRDGAFGLANIAATVAGILGIEPPACWEASMLK